MRVLLSDGSGLTSRQVATQAHAAGHTVEVLAPTGLGPARFTRFVARVHRVPSYGANPEAWLTATLAVLAVGRFDVLLPTQEQLPLLAREAERVRALGVRLAVPAFADVVRVQDKLAQATTLAALDLPHPATTVVRTAHELRAIDAFPVYVKAPIGTASASVHRVTDAASRAAAADALERADVFALDGGAVVQSAVPGPLVMVQSVFDRGRLVAWHANLRVREGASGGASHKRSLALPIAGEHLARLGGALRWHGALSLDAILTPAGPVYIDINPRLVEPGNAWHAGVDLVAALIAVSCHEPVAAPAPGRPDVPGASPRLDRRHAAAAPVPAGRPDIRTHQLLLAVLGAAQQGRGRRGVLRELSGSLLQRGSYAGSAEELTPTRGDWRAGLPVAVVAAATLLRPALCARFTDGSVEAYALTPAAWRAILAGRG